MPSASEAAGLGRTQFAATLAAGVNTLAQNQEITFRRYIRMILPLDGFAFWVRDDAVKQTSLLNAAEFNTAQFNTPKTSLGPPVVVTVKGSLHYTTDNNQDESEGFATNHVIFTSETEIEELNDIQPQTLMVGEFDGLKFAFSRRSSLYRQAQLYHYQGYAVYPAMETQMIEPGNVVDTKNVIVSNSLPIWLSLNKFMPMWPSYLVGDNVYPPWCSVHIEPSGTQALQSTPYLDQTGSHWQLAQDRVRLSIYGIRNFQIQDFVDYVNDFTLSSDVMGIMNMPIVRDEKRTQAELNILAQKKSIEYEVSYYQTRVRDIALKYITEALVSEILVY